MIITESQAKTINSLIKANCANYQNNECILLGSKCPQLHCLTSVLCKYCINCIIPLAPDLDAELKNQTRKNLCKDCNKPIEAKKQYCINCRLKRQKEKHKKYNKKRKQDNDFLQFESVALQEVENQKMTSE